ncbi:hypothetical protein ACS127_17945 [Amphibacillus sp. Q70]|uniref:hypothetical protein n=1 Tax=Amphibacillus sp. Q70 TaxID=3453416 RepID=UPI003F85948A
MKKKLLLISVLFTTFFLIVACGGDSTEDQSETPDQAEIEETADDSETTNESDEENIEVDKGLLNVEVTIPASFLDDDSDIDEIKAEAEKMGVTEITTNDDGSLTYKMPKSVHKEWLKQTADEIDATIQELVSSDDFVSIRDVEVNNDYSKFNMVVDRETFEDSLDGFATVALGVSGTMYQYISGTNSDDYNVTIDVVDESSGEVIDSIVFPEVLEDLDD